MNATYDNLMVLLEKALEHIEAPADPAVALEGSIAEGLGNSTSDIDFILLEDTDRQFSVMPALLFVDGRRIEMRSRSVRQVRCELATLFARAGAGERDLVRIEEGLIDRCQRFSHAIPLRNKRLFEAVQADLPQGALDQVISAWFAAHAQESLRCTLTLLTLGCELEAAVWARSALTECVKSWLAIHGDSYLPKKWTSEQLTRLSASAQLPSDVIALWTSDQKTLGDGTYAREVLRVATELGILQRSLDAEHITLKRRQNVTTWCLGDRTHIIKDRKEIYALGTRTARIWREIRFGKSLPTILEGMGSLSNDVGRDISEFHVLGFLDIEYNGDSISRRTTTTISPAICYPLLSLDGLVCSSEEKIRLAPISAERFAAAGMALIYANLVVENAQEDALGALKAGQWAVLGRSARRILRYLSLAIHSSYGINPLPSVEEGIARIRLLPKLAEHLVSEIFLLDSDVNPRNEQQASTLLERISRLTQHVRELTQATNFPLCFASSQDWQRTLDIGYDWIRIGAFLDAKYPIEEVRDMIATGGQQPHVKRSKGATSQPVLEDQGSRHSMDFE
jgi:hypothetical protein